MDTITLMPSTQTLIDTNKNKNKKTKKLKQK